MKINIAEFVISSVTVNKCPKPDRPEYAFIGRSNVGKSSLINMLTGRKKLAKISGSPGKTITINHFNINNEWYLVDLPGYGYAKRSKTERKKWNVMIQQYILTRPNLLSLFVLIDLRLEPQKIDLEFIEWLALSKIPFVLTFTKADKLSAVKADSMLAAYKKKLSESWEELPPIIVTSSQTGKGKDEVLDYIEKVNKEFKDKLN
jgi:GTP-binding protein